VFGSLALEVADHGQAGPLPPEAQRTDSRHRAAAAAEPDRFPRSAEAADVMAGYVSTQQYIWGLHRMLDGITASADLVAADSPAA
jgi:TetR/AcrR family tetracycline transcriptional repressor